MSTAPKVDLTNCDREPIHLLSAIQPIGFLLALTADWMVSRASANVAAYIGLEPDEMIGRPLAEIFEAHAIHELRNRSAVLRGPDATERAFGLRLTKADALYD